MFAFNCVEDLAVIERESIESVSFNSCCSSMQMNGFERFKSSFLGTGHFVSSFSSLSRFSLNEIESATLNE